MRARAEFYATPHVLMPFGNDFAFQKAGPDFAAMDALVAAINSDPATYGVTVRYSTLDEYFTALSAVSNVSFAMQAGVDFFPYIACSADCNDTAPSGAPDAWWTGSVYYFCYYYLNKQIRFVKLLQLSKC